MRLNNWRSSGEPIKKGRGSPKKLRRYRKKLNELRKKLK